MSGEKRRDFRRFSTLGMAVVTAGLIILHFTGRERALTDARNQVTKIHDQSLNLIQDEVLGLRDLLQGWERGALPPPPFTEVHIAGEKETPGMRLVAPKNGPHFWVDTFSPETDHVREGEHVIDAADQGEYSVVLNFPGQGKGRIEVEASFAGEPGPEVPDVPLEVLLRRGQVDPEPLGKSPYPVVRGAPTAHSFDITVGEDFRRVRYGLVFRVPPDAPPVKVNWRARQGDPQRRQVALGIMRTFPERPVWLKDTEENRLKEVILPAESVFLLGYVPLDHFRRKLLDPGLPRSPEDRIYVTDVAGTVVEAVPDYPEKIRKRVKSEGRTSLTSVATQRVKVRSPAGVDEYESFSRDRVIGTFGPLDSINGGLIVEREERLVLAGYRGLKAWHVAAVIFGLLLLYPLVPPFVRRIREDTELPRLLVHARRFLPHISVILVASILYAIGQGIFAYQGKVVTDEVILSEESAAYERLVSICWLLVLVALGMFGVNWVKEYLGKVIQNRLVNEIRCMLCEKIAQLPMAFHSRQRAGDLLSRIQNDVAETNRGLEMLFGDIVSDPILIVTLTASCFVINWRLALVVFVGLPVILLPISYFGQAIKKYSRRRQARKADVTHTINQMLSGIRVVKAFRMEEHEAKRIRAVSENFLTEALRVARAQVTSKELLELFSNLSVAVVLALGGYLVLERQVTVGDLTAFAALIARMYRSSKNLTSNYNKMQESLAGTERIFEVFDTPDTMADRPNARALVRPRSEIAFENVSFRYVEDGPWVLRNVNFRVPVGSSVALVGATGAGKTTMLDLVARFYDPQEGRISVDGVDLRDYSRTSLLAQVAVVTQEPFLFNASIAENLRYGRPGASQVEIEAAARAAFIHEEIVRQAEGYETVVGERGARLSGGQRQRVTIARAILRDPPILLLDEATSALDSRAEKAVQDALGNLMKDRTTFVIAHRLSTIQGVDRILVLEGGTIVEEGTHEDLLRIPDGHYRRLYEIQFAAALKQQDRGEAAAG